MLKWPIWKVMWHVYVANMEDDMAHQFIQTNTNCVVNKNDIDFPLSMIKQIRFIVCKNGVIGHHKNTLTIAPNL
jgi:hypothetical protein